MGGEATSPTHMLVKMELIEGEQVICLLRSSLLPLALGCSMAWLNWSQLELLWPRVASAQTPTCCPHCWPCATAGPQVNGGNQHPKPAAGDRAYPDRALLTRELKIVLKMWTWWVLSQPAARGACSGCSLSRRGIQLSFRKVGGKVQAGWKYLGTNLAQLSLGPAETCSEKKVDGKAFPVLPKDNLGTFSEGGWQGIKGKRTEYMFKMGKC